MLVEKALIEVLTGGRKGEQIKVLFNPNSYSLDHSNNYQWHKVPGLSMPIAQFTSGESPVLSMELFFDSSGLLSAISDWVGDRSTWDVRQSTQKIASLLEVDKDLHAPPQVKFVWGTLQFKGVITDLKQKFTMFSSQGNPIRATLNVTFKSVAGVKEQYQSIPRQSADRTKQKTLQQGDQLWMIADHEYENPGHWRAIADANGIDNPRKLEAGRKLVVPRLE